MGRGPYDCTGAAPGSYASLASRQYYNDLARTPRASAAATLPQNPATRLAPPPMGMNTTSSGPGMMQGQYAAPGSFANYGAPAASAPTGYVQPGAYLIAHPQQQPAYANQGYAAPTYQGTGYGAPANPMAVQNMYATGGYPGQQPGAPYMGGPAPGQGYYRR